jgi:predicted RNA-binding protein YlxR (DUF448 family)
MPKVRHVPLRRCLACRSPLPKAELIRFRRDESGDWQLDPTGRSGGRGAWICHSCAEEADPRRLRRFFRTQTDEIVTTLAAQAAAPTELHHPGGMHG